MEKLKRTALILLGGMATRAEGRPKYLFEYEGETFLSRQTRILIQVTDEIILSCRDEGQVEEISALFPYHCVIDLRIGMGPSEGIRVGANTARGDLIVVVACDMPLISSEVINLLFSRIGNADAAIPCWENGNLEPLHAVYRKEALIRYFSDHTSQKLRTITDTLDAVIVPVSEIRSIDPALKTFTNINDLQAYRSL